MPPTDRKGTLFGGDAVHVALILQTRATARRARNALSRLLRRYHAAEPASARDRGTGRPWTGATSWAQQAASERALR
jgi:hypothetical protein